MTLTIKRVLYWLEEHPTPTAEEICAALGSPSATPTVRSLLFKLKEDYRIVATMGGCWMLAAEHRVAESAVLAARKKGIDTDAIIG
jgi:hypothetical protein